MKKRYFRREQKYGIELPKTVKRALEIDTETGTTFWRDAIRKEMNTVGKAFKILESDEPIPVGHTLLSVHIVFDVKNTFQRKARLVADGHLSPDVSKSITYASVVSRESVRLVFMLAALNGLKVETADIQGAYLNAPCAEKYYIICGAEFGPQFEGHRAVIIRALYGLKSAGASWRKMCADVLIKELGFTQCKADNDVYLKPATKEDGSEYYEYVLVYTDDLLVISMDPRRILLFMDQHFLLKPDSIGKPTKYLGADIGTHIFPGDDGTEYWYMGSEQYVKEAVRNVETWLDLRGRSLKSKAASVLPLNYTPELDCTPLLTKDDIASYYPQLIGITRWMVELGRIDICTEVSVMSSYAAAPRVGHLEAMFHMFAYLKSHNRSKMVFDSTYVPMQEQPKPDWTKFYGDVKEELPPDMPQPRGKPVQMTTYEDSDHAGDKLNRRSRTGVLMYCNRSPIAWKSVKQLSVETSSFGSEFTALRTAVELSLGLRYKLRMMGVPIDGPIYIKGDNMSVITNSSVPESMLKKKSNSIAFHFCREESAKGTVVISYEPSQTNLADMLTKIQGGMERQKLVQRVLF